MCVDFFYIDDTSLYLHCIQPQIRNVSSKVSSSKYFSLSCNGKNTLTGKTVFFVYKFQLQKSIQFLIKEHRDMKEKYSTYPLRDNSQSEKYEMN